MSDVLTASVQNGSVPDLPHAAAIVQQLRDLIKERQARLAELDKERARMVAELDEQRARILGEVKVYEQALKPLTGEARKRNRKSQAPVTTRVGPERLEELKEFIRTFSADHEEFRQVDIRAAMGTWSDGVEVSSGSTASAFETLRQEPHNFIRIARVSGNNKFFRLTREALRS